MHVVRLRVAGGVAEVTAGGPEEALCRATLPDPDVPPQYDVMLLPAAYATMLNSTTLPDEGMPEVSLPNTTPPRTETPPPSITLCENFMFWQLGYIWIAYPAWS